MRQQNTLIGRACRPATAAFATQRRFRCWIECGSRGARALPCWQ